MTAPATLARNASLQDLVEILRGQQPRRYDVVVPATAVRAERGNLVLAGAGVEITQDGVTTTDGVYTPTAVCDSGIADKLGIPPSYLTKMRAERIDLYDSNVNGWLHGVDLLVDAPTGSDTWADTMRVRYEPAQPDRRRFLVRCFRNESGTDGVARAFLSDSYKPIENLDVLMTALEGIGAAGVAVEIVNANLTDRNMYVKIRSTEVQALAPTLLKNYVSPFSRQRGADNPVVFAGFVLSNSEVGHGAFSIAPYLEIQVCTNGMVRRDQAIRAQHLGGKLPEGEIAWADDTQAKNLELIGLRTRDAIQAFLSQEWLEREIAKAEAKSGVELAKPDETIKQVAAKLRYTQNQQDEILSMFIKGADVTAGGVMHAVTAAAQTHPDADVAADMEADAFRVLDLAVQYAS
jgi:hypothetical protein